MRDGEPAFLARDEIVALADIIEAEQLQHHVMDRVLARRGKGNAVMALIHMQEIKLVGAQEIVAELESEDVAIERHHRFDAFDVQHDMAKPERAGSEAGNIAPRHERLGSDLGAVEKLERGCPADHPER